MYPNTEFLLVIGLGTLVLTEIDNRVFGIFTSAWRRSLNRYIRNPSKGVLLLSIAFPAMKLFTISHVGRGSSRGQ
jgi:hypothetical protein